MSARVAAELGGLSVGNLGLKAGFWKCDSKTMSFRPIVGWVTISNYIQAGKRPLVSLVLDDNSFPVFASPCTFPDYAGVFKEASSPQEAAKVYESQLARLASTRPPSTGCTSDTPDPLE